MILAATLFLFTVQGVLFTHLILSVAVTITIFVPLTSPACLSPRIVT